MRKLAILASMVAISLSSFADAVTNFANIEWLTTSSVARELMLNKGYEFTHEIDRYGATDLYFLGKLGDSEAHFALRFTLDDELVQVAIATDELVSAGQAYQSLLLSLKSKYGDSELKQDKRSSQFMDISSISQISEGIRLGEIYWSNLWRDGAGGIRLETLKGGIVKIDYFSEYWPVEYDRRQKGKTDDL